MFYIRLVKLWIILIVLTDASMGYSLSYGQRAELTANPVAKKLFTLMHEKKTNLALAADVTTKAELLQLADLVGPEICMLKTHIDIITDFDWDLIVQLQALAVKHNFLLCEDRKFADLGTTVQMQYAGGMYHIEQWADIIIAHGICGASTINALRASSITKPHGLLLIAQLSAANNLITPDYCEAVKKLAAEYSDFVIGFICQEKCGDNPGSINATPGINKATGAGSFDQQYNSPEYAVQKRGTDIIIVGRAIYQAADALQAAREYRAASWHAYSFLTSTFSNSPTFASSSSLSKCRGV